MARGIGTIKVGNKRIWSLEYADDLVLLAEGEEVMRETMKRLGPVFEEKEIGTERGKIADAGIPEERREEEVSSLEVEEGKYRGNRRCRSNTA